MSIDKICNRSVEDIMKILPHRYPFLLVDKVRMIDLDLGKIVAQKNLSHNESFFQGHFPGSPIMPGVLIIESLAQAGGIMVYLKGGFQEEKLAVLLNIKNAKFRAPARPGDILELHCEGKHFSSKGGRVNAWAVVDEKVVAEAELGFALIERVKK